MKLVTRTRFGATVTVAAVFIFHNAALAQGSADSVLARMDQTAPAFKALSARLTRINYTKVIDDKSEETGTITIRKTGPKLMKILVHYEKPDVKDWALSGNRFEIFYPKLNTVQEYDVGRRADDLLAIGFGSTGKDLAKTFSVKYAGEEKVAGQTTSKLRLVPKSKQALEYVSSIDLWYDDAGGYPIQQKFYQPSGDYNLVTYSDVKLNPALKEGDAELKLPKGVKRERPQK